MIEAIDSSGSMPMINTPIMKGEIPYIMHISFRLSKKISAEKKMIKYPAKNKNIHKISVIILNYTFFMKL